MNTRITLPPMIGAVLDYVYDAEAEKRGNYRDPIGAKVVLTFGSARIGDVPVSDEQFRLLVSYAHDYDLETIENKVVEETVAETLGRILTPGSEQ